MSRGCALHQVRMDARRAAQRMARAFASQLTQQTPHLVQPTSTLSRRDNVLRDGRFRAASLLLVLAGYPTLLRTRRLESTSKSTRRAPLHIVQRLPSAGE